MKSNMINVSVEFVIDALQARYDDVKELWGCDASEALWEQALQLVEECELGENFTSPSIFVDNYLINGEFVSKIEDVDQWLDETTFADYCGHHNLNDLQIAELKASPMFNEFWNDYCEDKAIFYNDDFACLQF